MTVGVVDLFEMVEVDEDKRKLVIVTLRAVDFGFENKAHVAGVVKAGAVVGDGQLVNAFYVPGILESDGGEIGEGLQQLEVAVVETLRAETIDELDDAKTGVAEFDGHGNDGLRLCFGLFIDLAEEARVLGSVGDNDGLAMLRDPAGNSLADLDADVLESLRSFADCKLEVEFLFSFVEKKKRPIIRAEKLVNFLHDGAENLVKLQGRGEGFAQFLEYGNFAGLALFGGDCGITATLHGRELLDFVHARLIPGLKI